MKSKTGRRDRNSAGDGSRAAEDHGSLWSKGTIKKSKAGEFTVEEVVAVVETENGDRELTLMQKWPVRRGRPYKRNFRQRCRL